MYLELLILLVMLDMLINVYNCLYLSMSMLTLLWNELSLTYIMYPYVSEYTFVFKRLKLSNKICLSIIS